MRKIIAGILITISLIFGMAITGCADDYSYDGRSYERPYKEEPDESDSYIEGYDDGYEAAREEYESYDDSERDSFLETIQESPDDFGINSAVYLLSSIQEDHSELYKEIIDTYGLGNLPSDYFYYVIDVDNGVGHKCSCEKIKNINPYTAEIRNAVDDYMRENYTLCPVCLADMAEQ